MPKPSPLLVSARLLTACCILLVLYCPAVVILHRLYLVHPTLDLDLLNSIHTHATPTLTTLALALSFLGSPRTVWPLTILLATILWLGRRRRPACLLTLTMATAGTLESLVKLIVRRPRFTLPWAYVHEASFSFPSGHATLAVALYGVFVWLVSRTPHPLWQRAAALVAAVTLIPAIGLSRLYLGAHYPTDVLAGYLTGAACLALIIAADLAL